MAGTPLSPRHALTCSSSRPRGDGSHEEGSGMGYLKERQLPSTMTALAALIFSLVIGLGVLITPGVAGAASIWTVSASYPGSDVTIYKVACPSTSDCYAAGYNGA